MPDLAYLALTDVFGTRLRCDAEWASTALADLGAQLSLHSCFLLEYTDKAGRLLVRVSTSSYHIPALDRAMKGVDAVICAYSGRPSFNPFHSFRQQVAITSTIKPIWIFTGVLAEVFFSVPGHGDLSPKNHGIWDPVAKSIDLFGTGREKFDWTTEVDAAAFSIAIIESPNAHQGGFYSIRSGCHSLNEIKATYERVRGTPVKVIEKGSVEDLEKAALQARLQGSPLAFWEYIGYFYQLYTINGAMALRNLDNDRFPDVKATSLEDFLGQNPSI